ncbi:MAG TPA: S9 family peptidase [Polyangiaceae bacterium]
MPTWPGHAACLVVAALAGCACAPSPGGVLTAPRPTGTSGTVAPPAPLLVPRAITDPAQVISRSGEEAPHFAPEKLFMTRVVGGTAWSPDGAVVAFITNISGRANLWTVPSDGGSPVQLAVSDQRQTSPVWSPDGRWIALTSDVDGDEQWDILLVSPKSGEVLNLTQTPDVAEEHPRWSPDGAMLTYTVKPKAASNYEIDMMDVASRKVRHVTTGTPKDLVNQDPIWSPDGKRIAFTRTVASLKDSNVFVAEIGDGKLSKVTDHAGEHRVAASAWSPDGAKLLVTSDAANGYSNAALLDLTSTQLDWVTLDRWEVESGSFSPDGKTLTDVANVDGDSDVFLYDLGTRHAERLPLPRGTNHLGGAETAFTRDGARLLFFHNGYDSPNDVWTYALRAGEPRRITSSLGSDLRGEDMVEPQLIHYPSRDKQWTISALAYVPRGFARDGKSPAIVFVHGGPTAQATNSWNRLVQLLANQGYVVVAPNYRGSTGYGKAFEQANLFDMGGGDLTDVLEAAEIAKRTGYVDPKKMVILGGSYGAYMTMMAVTKAPETWAAGVALAPFVNWFTAFENEDPLQREMDRAMMGDPVRNKELWRDRSPIFFVDRITAPLLLTAGAHDPLCPREEADQVVEALRRHGGVAELKVYDNEGHNLSRVENQIDAGRRIVEFVRKYVPPPGRREGAR